MKNYTTCLVLKDGTMRLGPVVELDDEEHEANIDVLRRTLAEHDVISYETRAKTDMLVPVASIAYIEIQEA